MSTTVTWTATSSGDWSDAANWSGGAVPDSADNVLISTSTVQTITYDSGNDTINELSVGNDHFIMAAGSLEVLTKATFDDGFIQTGGTIENGTFSVLKSGTLIGGSATGSTVFSIGGGIALANYTLAGSAVLNNASSIVSQTGQITVGDDTGVNATINNEAKGTYDIAGDFGITDGAASAVLDNAGLLAKSAGSGTSDIGIDVVSTGTISADAGGTLEFSGPNSTISGALTGAGQIGFGGYALLDAGTISVATLGIFSGADVVIETNTTLSGALNDSSYLANTLNLGTYTLTVDGGAAFTTGYQTDYVTGSGSLVLQGTSTLGSVEFGGSLAVSNNGTADQVSQVTLGDSSGQSATIVNAAGALYDFTQDVGLGGGNNAVSFTNKGTLEKTQSTGTSEISIVVTNTAAGVIDAAGGTLAFDDSLTNAGTITGAGAVVVNNSGTVTLGAGTALGVAQFDMYDNAVVDLSTSLTYSGIFNDNGDGSDFLSLGANTLTLTGRTDTLTSSYQDDYVEGNGGNGTLVNGGTLTAYSLVFGTGSNFVNSGTVDQGGYISIGDNTAQVSSITNAAKAIWNANNASDTLVNGSAGASSFTNSGTFNANAGANNSVTISTNFTNTAGATIDIASGSLLVNGTLSNAGTITGGGYLTTNNSGVLTLSAGTVLSTAGVTLYNNATLNIGLSLTYNGVFTDQGFGSDTLNLGANTLTLTGSSNTLTSSYQDDYVEGTGKLTNAGTLAASSVVIGGGSTFLNTKTVNQTGSISIGDTNASLVDNAAGAVWNATNGSSTIGIGTSNLSSFENFGTFNASAPNGSSVTLSTNFVNEKGGTIDDVSGGLINTNSLVNAGTISGAYLGLVGSSQTTLSAGNLLKVSEVSMQSNAVLNLGTSVNYDGDFSDTGYGTDLVNLAGFVLTLKGPASFISGFQNDVISGGGTLVTEGATQLSGAQIGGGTTWVNDKTITATGNLAIGDGTSMAGTFSNSAAAIYDLTNDAGIGVGSSLASSFINKGLFEKTNGTGTSVVSSPFVNDGTITVSSGTVEFTAGTLINNGTIHGTESEDQNGNIFITHS